MVATLICPTSCGFARVAAFEIVRETTRTLQRENGEGTTKLRARLMQECYKQFEEAFKDRAEEFSIEFLKLQKKTSPLRAMFSNWNPGKKRRKGEIPRNIQHSKLEKNGASEKKSEHSFANCKGCYHRYADVQALLPAKSNQFVEMAKENPFFVAGKQEQKIKPLKATEVQDIARALYNKIDATFQKVCNTSFGETLTKLPELQIQKKKSPTEAKRERRAMYRNYKQKVEDDCEKTYLLR